MFQLTRQEYRDLKSQIVILGQSPRATPYAFTEHGAVMLASVLNSPVAVAASVAVVRAFVRLRHLIGSNAALARKLTDLEKKYDGQFRAVFDALRQLMAGPKEKRRPRIGYETEGQRRRGRR